MTGRVYVNLLEGIWYVIYIYILEVYSWENNGKSSIRATPMVNGQSWWLMIIVCWLVVWNMNFWLSIYWEQYSQLTNSYVSEGLNPPTRYSNYRYITSDNIFGVIWTYITIVYWSSMVFIWISNHSNQTLIGVICTDLGNTR